MRPFVPLAKKLLGGGSASDSHDPSSLLESRPYKLYLKTIYPIERAVASAWPGALAFQMIFEARRKRMKLTISMITLNEERAVAKVVGDIRARRAGRGDLPRRFEQGPHGGDRHGARLPRLQAVPAERLRAGDGPRRARCRGDIVITLDCDDTYPVETIPTLVSLIDEGYDLVNATRLAKRPKAMPFANYLANRVFARRTQSWRDFLIRTSIANGFATRIERERTDGPHRRTS